MEIEYTKEGMKITHPTGVVQLLSSEDLTRLKNSQEQCKASIEADIERLDFYVTETRTAEKPL